MFCRNENVKEVYFLEQVLFFPFSKATKGTS